jgi:hypothetical protein
MSNLTIGVDVGDKFSALYVVDAQGEWVESRGGLPGCPGRAWCWRRGPIRRG